MAFTTLEPPAKAPAEEASAPESGRFRPDIDGLRAIAILLVVAYHAEVPGFDAGFVGVDVFFVISGFLITRLLVAEMDGTGTVQLRRFWARRARRLLPAASVVTIFCLVAGTAVLSPLDWGQLANEGLATTTYWSNLLFGFRAADYFDAGIRSSPLLHTWSLSVEEQFYLVWPLLLLGVFRLGRGAGADARRLRLLALGLISTVSFALSLRLTDQQSAWAFFSSASRAWELGAGAMLAVASPFLVRAGRKAGTALHLAGVVLLAGALVTIDSRTPFPGWAATLPVLGTLALLAAGAPGGPLTRLFSARPLQGVGRLSYSWYLWHWPVLVLGVAHFGPAGVPARVALAMVSLVPAALTHRYIENPIRRSRTLAASPLRTLGVVALIVSVTLGVGLVTRLRASEALRDPRLQALAAARADRPPLADACATTDAVRLEEHCVSGDPDGTRTILVIGDSHAAQWLPAIDGAARKLGARVVNSLQGSCPSVGFGWDGERPSCEVRRGRIPDLVDDLRPDLVVVSHSVGYIGHLAAPSGLAAGPDHQLETWTDGLGRFAARMRDTGTPLAVILDTPRHQQDPIQCLSFHDDAAGCGMSLRDALGLLGPFHEAEADALRRAGHGSAFDPLPYLCDNLTCPATTRDGTVVYADGHHLTAGYSAALADRLRPFLEAGMGSR